MTKQEFLVELEEMLELDSGTLKGDELLSELDGWDSMAAIGFIALVDTVSGIAVAPIELANSKSISDLAALAKVQD